MSGVKERVLVVDDDPELLKTVASYLSEDYDVSLAKSGAAALRLLERAEKPGLILLDIDMPGMDGYQVLERLKSGGDTKAIPVVFLTGLRQEEHESRGLDLGAMDYVKKPVGRGVLLSRVRLHLGVERRLREKGTLDEEKLAGLIEPLTERELEVARLLAGFYSNEEIARRLCLSLSRVKKLVTFVLEKLGLERRDEIRRYLK